MPDPFTWFSEIGKNWQVIPLIFLVSVMTLWINNELELGRKDPHTGSTDRTIMAAYDKAIKEHIEYRIKEGQKDTKAWALEVRDQAVKRRDQLAINTRTEYLQRLDDVRDRVIDRVLNDCSSNLDKARYHWMGDVQDIMESAHDEMWTQGAILWDNISKDTFERVVKYVKEHDTEVWEQGKVRHQQIKDEMWTKTVEYVNSTLKDVHRKIDNRHSQ